MEPGDLVLVIEDWWSIGHPDLEIEEREGRQPVPHDIGIVIEGHWRSIDMFRVLWKDGVIGWCLEYRLKILGQLNID